MNESMKRHWQLYFQKYPNSLYMKGFENILAHYLTIEKGKIVDIGCGQSQYLLDMLDTQHELYATDDEPTQLDFLRKRIHDLGFDTGRVSYSEEKFPPLKFDNIKFDGVILSNLLHFYSFEKTQMIVNDLKNRLNVGCLILVTVHSHRHSSNKRSNPDRYNYFKHYFTTKDLNTLFPKKEFELLYFSNIQSKSTPRYQNFSNEWVSSEYRMQGLTEQEIKKEIQKRNKGKMNNSFTMLVKWK